MKIGLDLITACINRERKAEYELYKMTYSYLMSVCFRYTNSGERARELVIPKRIWFSDKFLLKTI